MGKLKYLFAVLLLLIPSIGYATTYTVCNSGCTGTGIQAVINATDLNYGDILEVRADTEGGSKTYTENITIGAADGGTAEGGNVIIRARAGDTITLDGNDANAVVITVSGSYITVDGFRIINPGSYGILTGGANATSKNSGVIIQNNTITAGATANTSNAIDGIVVRYADNCIVYNNTYSTTTGTTANQYDGIYIQASTNVDVNKNSITIQADNWLTENVAAGHNDCIQVAGGNGSIPYGSTGNIAVRNNTCYHNNSINKNRQFMYFEYEITGYLYVYNNVMWKPSGNGSYGLYRQPNGRPGTSGTTYFYNNSMYIGGISAGCYITAWADTYIKGNSCHINYGSSAVIIEVRADVPDANINYNIGYKTATSSAYRIINSDGNLFRTFAQWQALGYDTNGAFDNPDYTAVTDPPNFVPATGSPLIDAFPTASAPTSLFTNDILNADRPSGSAWDVGAYEKGGSADTTRPTISSATIDATGTTLTIVFSEPVVVNTSTGFTLDMDDGTGEGLTYASGSTTNTLVYNITVRMIETDAEGTLDYVTVTNGIEDLVGNDLASTGESDVTVTNNSEHTPTVTSYTVTPSTNAGCAISPDVASTVPTGETKAFTCTAASANHSCVAWTGTCGGTGTTSFTSSAITADCTVVQPCFKIAPGITIGSGAAVTLGSGAVGTLY